MSLLCDIDQKYPPVRVAPAGTPPPPASPTAGVADLDLRTVLEGIGNGGEA
jgi:hypothetical protein